MKRILSTLTLLLCCAFTAVNAQVITVERAAEIANSFFSAGVQKSGAARGVVASSGLTASFDSNDVTDAASANPTFYVLTNPEGGFVIVSGEETENPIIGYSFDGTIDTGNLPDGFVDYMTDIDAQVKALREYNTNNPQKAAAARSAMARAADFDYNANTMGEIVVDLKTAPWGQSAPFNKLCPSNTVTGCVPTAYSILCHYYKWPEQGAGTVYNPSTGDPLQLGHTYDYASMRNDNYPSGYTDAEATAVATLMRDMGYAYTATYGSGTTTTSSENPSNLIKYFGFKCETPLDHGNYCTKYDLVNNMEQWVTYIKNCLNAGYPIPYSSTTALDADDRHIYILDGYTDNNYFHFNWGWKGQGNGWFTLDNMVPDDYSNYSKSHRAYLNVIPDKTTYPVTATVNDSNMGTVSINSGTAGSSATASLMQGVTATLTAHPAQGYALASWTKNGVVVGSRNTIEVTVGTDANDYVANFDAEANVLVVKEYTVNPANGSLSGGTSKYSTWTSTDTQPALTLKATNASGAAVYAISALSSSYKAYATAYDSSDKAHTNITYTLSVPEGYVITNYLMTYNVRTAGQISLNGELLNATGDHTLSATPNAQTASFTLSVPSAGQQYITVKSIAVTVQSEGGTGGSTPTTYTISVAAGEGGSAYIDTKGTTEKTVSYNDNLTITAEANDGYRFVEWRAWNSHFSSKAQQDVTVTTDVTYTAVFEAEAQTEQFPDGAYKIFWQADKRGYLAYHGTARPDEAVLADVEYTGYNDDHYNSSTDPVDLVWYLITASDGKRYLFEVATGKFLGVNTSVYDNGQANKLSTTEAWPIAVEENTHSTRLGHYIITTMISGTKNLLCSGCGTSSFNGGHPVRWLVVNDNNQKDGGAPLQLVKVDDVTVTDDVMNAVLAVINSTEKTLDVTYSGATWNNATGSWWVSVVTNTTPVVTVKTTDGTPKIGFSTVKFPNNVEIRHPYLLDGNSFTISVPANYKIKGYRLGYQAHNLVSKSVTYTNGKESTGIVTITQSNEQNTLTVTGLDNNEISFSVEDQTTQAGFIIKSLEITYVENEPLPFKAEIEGWRNDNPNTHLGTITIGGTAMKLTPEHLNASELTMPLTEGTALAFTRKYRGFEFNGFYIGSTPLGENPTLTADNVAAIDENNPLVAKFTATDDVTLFYDDDEFSYRIPAIVKTVKDDKHKLIAISDYRHSYDDIGRDKHQTGTTQVDLVIRTSEDNGATWSAKQTIAEGSQRFGYGDAAAVANGQDVLVMAVAGNVFYAYANSDNPQQAYRIYSNDNGVTWEKEDISSNMESLFPDYHGLFFGSGKLAVDPDFNGSGNARVYGAILMKDSQGERNYVLYSDNWGKTWNILGNAVAARQNEPKVEILPNGQILLSARRGGGRTFNVFTYTDKANNAGTWSTATNGCDNGGNSTNGEIICLDAKRPNGKPTKILLQSQPYGGDRRNVSIWYKEISANETYTGTSIASDWTMGKQVSTQLSAYSAMCLQENGEIALFFEEAPCYGDDHTKGYSMVYVPLTIEEITNNAFLNPNAVVEPTTVDVTLTDAQGNIYTHQFDYLPGDAAAIDAALKAAYPFITLGENGNLEQTGEKAYTYTNTVTLPFKVSNANTTVWHNIYWPSYNPVSGSGKIGCPVYLSATEGNSNVPKVTADAYYGESEYNTLNWADRLSWAVYNVNNSFTFKFKNKLTGKYIQATSVATGNAQNVVYANENNATAFELLPDSYSYVGDYALVAKVGETTGYLCSTSATGYHYATHYNGSATNRHEGAWVKFVEAPDYQAIVDALTENVAKFGAGNGNYTDNNDINAIKAIIENIASTPLNTLNTHTETVQTVKESYTEITLTVPAVNDVVPGSVKILNEPVSHKFVQKGEVTIEAVPAAGYYFVNWTRPAAQASAAARTAEARNSNVVSDQNPYTVTVSEALNLEANFEEIVANVTLNDIQGNTYKVTLSGLTGEVNAETLEAKLKAEYPFIEEFGINPTFADNGTSYTYKNSVKLMFKVSKTTDDPKTDNLWHNIYYPSNNIVGSKPGCPNYIAALNEDEVVDMAASSGYAYGANPTYNTMDGNPNISWAIYNVNDKFEFILKSAHTGKYIKVGSVSTETTANVSFVDNAGDATAFTLLADTGGHNGDYALVAKVGDATGYLCATSSSKNFVTYFSRTNHEGAWVKIEETDYDGKITALDNRLLYFNTGNDKYMLTSEIQAIIDAMGTDINPLYRKMTLNTIEDHIVTVNNKIDSWPKLSLTINPVEGGTTTIAGEEGVTRKYVPTGDLTINATPAEGYHFVSWTDGASEIITPEYIKTISGGKGDVIELTANFAKNSYNVSVTAGEGGSASAGAATVEHGNEVTLTATPSTGYSFAGWYDGETLKSAEASYTFTVTSHINYTARFNEEAGETPTTVAIHVTVASTDGTTVTNDEGGNVKAVINNVGMGWCTAYDFKANADVELVAIHDHNESAYLFEGWYKNDVLVNKAPEITVKATEAATYEARFSLGRVITLASSSKTWGYPNIITYENGDPVAGTATKLRAVVRDNERLLISINPNYGYRVANWTDKNGYEVAGKNANSFILTVNGDNNYTANLERATYTLTVRANNEGGTVSAESVAGGSGTGIIVGHNMEATITAIANPGNRFVEWTTTDGTHVSDEKTYTVPAIENVEDMVDVEYVAVFEEIGTYYRIAYNFEVPVETPAKSAATRAAGEETITISPATGDVASSVYSSVWNYNVDNNPAGLKIVATDSESNRVTAITASTGNPSKLRFYAGHNFEGTSNKSSAPTTFTLSVNENYVITGYSLKYIVSSASKVTISNEYGYNETPKRTYQTMEKTDISVQSIAFNVSAASSPSSYYAQADVFTVTIQPVGSETPEPDTETVKYYVQSEACGVSGKENALKMTTVNDNASSIFYCVGNKLMSYAKGTYVNENGNTRGLQAVGVAGGDVTFESNKIKFTNGTNVAYMHAKESNGIYYVDNCGATATCGNDDHNFIFEEVESLPVTISAAGYASWYAPVAVSLPSGIEAWYFDGKIGYKGEDKYAIMAPIGGDVVPANTGVILTGKDGKPAENGTYYLAITDEVDPISGNLLEGTVATEYVADDAYVLSKPNGKEIGFYLAAMNKQNNTAFQNNSHKAYLPKDFNSSDDDALQSAGFRFSFGGTTDIEEVETESSEVNAIYDLTGRKLEGISGAGIYIVNGKKVLIK